MRFFFPKTVQSGKNIVQKMAKMSSETLAKPLPSLLLFGDTVATPPSGPFECHILLERPLQRKTRLEVPDFLLREGKIFQDG